MDTAISPPRRTKIAFIRIEVILPAILFKKLGLPQVIICLIILRLNCGLQKCRIANQKKNGKKAAIVQTSIPEQVARAAAQIPQ